MNRRRLLARLTVGATSAAAATVAGGWWWSHERHPALLGTEIRRVEGTGPRVALTLDDGPWPDHLPEVLEVLAARSARATFFVNGEALEKRPDLGRQLVEAGHELASLGGSHAQRGRNAPA